MRPVRLFCLTLLMALLLSLPAMADTTITITFTGDVTLGGEDYLRSDKESFASVYDQEGPIYFLENFAEFFAEDDLTVINLEGVLTDNDKLPVMDKGKGTGVSDSYWFRGKEEYVRILTAASVEVASLANNHTMDYGEAGLRDTIAALEGAGIGWFNTHAKNTTDTEKFFFYEKDGVRICLLSLYWDDYSQGDPNGNGAWLSTEIARLKESGEADAVIAILHGGQEYGRHRTKPQTVFTAMAMRAGADLVICHHAHVVMGMDVINNRSAFYSLGNFCFGGNRKAYMLNRRKVQDAAPALIVRAELFFDDEGKYKGQQMTLVPVQTTSQDRAAKETTQRNDYRPKFITGPLAAHVLHLMQIDMNYDLQNAQNKELKDLVIAREEELMLMESSEGMELFKLPYLPADPE